MRLFFLVLASILLLSSCSPKIAVVISNAKTPLKPQERIDVYKVKDSVPEKAHYIGDFRILDTGFTTNCGYSIVIGEAKAEARKVGGNLIKLTKHKEPSIFGSSCHQLEGGFYLLNDSYVPTKKDSVLSVSKINKTNTRVSKQIQLDNKKYSKHRFAVDGGYSFRTARIDENADAVLRQYIKGVKSGYHLEASYTYFYNKKYGIGLVYSNFAASNRMDDITLTDNFGNTVNTYMSDDMTITFVGPSFTWRYPNINNENVFYADYSLGYMGYVNKSHLVEDVTISGNTLGANLGIGYDIKLNKNFQLGLKANLLGGTLKKLTLKSDTRTKVVNLKEGEYESLLRIDFSVGFRYVID